MNLRDITDAVADADMATIQQAFRALVDYPNEERIEASSPGLLVVALNRVCAALKHDESTMPRATCDALDLPPGVSYADGVVKARAEQTRLSRTIVARFAA